MNEDTIRDIYYVEHKWNPHFFYLSPKSFCQDLEKNGSDLYLDLFHAMYQEESDYICPYTENDFSLRKKLCNNGTTIIYQLITPSPVLSPLTRCVYFCCQLDKQQYFYYTSELTHTGDYRYADGQRMKHISFSIQMHLHLRKNWKKFKNFLRR